VCISVEEHRNFGGKYSVHLQDQRVSQVRELNLVSCFFLVSFLAYSSTLKREALSCFETSIDFHRNTQRYVPVIVLLRFRVYQERSSSFVPSAGIQSTFTQGCHLLSLLLNGLFSNDKIRILPGSLTTSSFLVQQRGQTDCSLFSLSHAGFSFLSLLFVRQECIYDEYVNRICTSSSIP
jgi:hypothetical protein